MSSQAVNQRIVPEPVHVSGRRTFYAVPLSSFVIDGVESRNLAIRRLKWMGLAKQAQELERQGSQDERDAIVNDRPCATD